MTARTLGALHRAGLRGGLVVLALPLRGLLALLGWLGLFRVAAITGFLWWAAPLVGLRPAGWLVAIAWAHRLTRHKRAALYRHEIVRRAERALDRQVAALERQLAAAGRAASRSLRRLGPARHRSNADPAQAAAAQPPTAASPRAAVEAALRKARQETDRFGVPRHPPGPPPPPVGAPSDPTPLGFEPMWPRWLGGGRWRQWVRWRRGR